MINQIVDNIKVGEVMSSAEVCQMTQHDNDMVQEWGRIDRLPRKADNREVRLWRCEIYIVSLEIHKNIEVQTLKPF